MAHTANAFMLNLVELVHWTPIIPAFLMAQSILSNSDKWSHYFDNDEQRTLLFLLSPIIAFFGGLPGIMMHTYEGWQVAPFDSPLRGEAEDTNVVVSDKNNQWLRIVAYFFIFNMQYIGLQAFSYAILGPTYFDGCLKMLSILGFFIGYLGNQDYKATFNFKWKNTAGGSTFPLAWIAVALGAVLVFLDESIGKSSKPLPRRIWASTYPAVNKLSIARFFLFGSRDIWFVVALPIFLDESLGWSFEGIGAFLAAWVIGYGIIQSGAPSVIRLKDAAGEIQASTRLWSFTLMIFTILLAVLVAFDIAKSFTVIVGLLLFGVLFALNSSLHSYLILAFTEDDSDVAVNVGLYYSANAFGRLFGTLLSGLTYLWGGLSAALFTCCGFLTVNWLISFSFPKRIKSGFQ